MFAAPAGSEDGFPARPAEDPVDNLVRRSMTKTKVTLPSLWRSIFWVACQVVSVTSSAASR